MELDSEPSHDSCLALLSGSAINQDGQSSSLTAPNGPSQQALICSALDTTDGRRAADYNALEMHGTGTSLGDPIEMGAAAQVLLTSENSTAPLAVRASKSAHGHAEAGAGILNTVHALTSINYAYTCCLTHLRSLNPYVAETTAKRALTSAPKENVPISTPSDFAALTGICCVPP